MRSLVGKCVLKAVVISAICCTALLSGCKQSTLPKSASSPSLLTGKQSQETSKASSDEYPSSRNTGDPIVSLSFADSSSAGTHLVSELTHQPGFTGFTPAKGTSKIAIQCASILVFNDLTSIAQFFHSGNEGGAAIQSLTDAQKSKTVAVITKAATSETKKHIPIYNGVRYALVVIPSDFNGFATDSAGLPMSIINLNFFFVDRQTKKILWMKTSNNSLGKGLDATLTVASKQTSSIIGACFKKAAQR